MRYYRALRLLYQLAIARGDGLGPKMLSRLSAIRVLVLDDWGTAPLGSVEGPELMYSEREEALRLLAPLIATEEDNVVTSAHVETSGVVTAAGGILLRYAEYGT